MTTEKNMAKVGVINISESGPLPQTNQTEEALSSINTGYTRYPSATTTMVLRLESTSKSTGILVSF